MSRISHFKDREVRSPTLQMVHELELKRRSYGHLKTTAQSWAEISQPKAHFAAAKWAAKPTFGTRVPFRSPCLHLRSCEPRWEITSKLQMKLRIISMLRNHLQVVKSHSTCKIKVQTWKMDNSTREIHLCNLRYLLPTKLDFFSQDIFCKFLFSPCNQSKILLGYFLENIFSIYIFEPM